MKKKIIYTYCFLLFFCNVFAQQNSSLALKCGKIYTITGPIIDDGILLIKGSKIYAVGADISIPQNFRILDLSDKVVLPGLIDAHTHIGAISNRPLVVEYDANERTDIIEPQMRIIDGINIHDESFEKALNAGVTTIINRPGSAALINGQAVAMKTYGTKLADMIIKYPCDVKFALGMNPKVLFGQNKTRMGLAAILREALEKAKKYKEKWDKYKQNPEENDKPDIDLELEPLKNLQEGKLPAHVHCARADDILFAIELAEEYNFDISLGHGYEAHKVAEILAEKDIPVCIGPDLLGWDQGTKGKKPVDLGGILARAGVRVSIQTDGIFQYNLWLQAAICVRNGMDFMDALKAITIHAAELGRIQDRVGSIEVGKDADLVVLNDTPLEPWTQVDMVIVEGEIVFEKK